MALSPQGAQPRGLRGSVVVPTPQFSAMLNSMLRAIDEIKKLVPKIQVDRASFLTLSFCLGELRLVLADLPTNRDSLTTESTSAVQRIEDSIMTASELVRMCTRRGRIFLLFNSEKIVRDAQNCLQEVGYCLNLMPVLGLMAASLSGPIHDKLPDLRARMRNATFEPDPGNTELAEAIAQGVESHMADASYATELLARIAKQLDVPMAQAGKLREEVHRDLIAAEADKRDVDAKQLFKLKQLLERSVLATDHPRLSSDSVLGKKLYRTLSSSAPERLKCMLSGQVMSDPVLLVQTGRTYERANLEAWFASGNATCPDTGQTLKSFEVVPNTAIKAAVEEDFEFFNQKTLVESAKQLDSERAEVREEALETMLQLCRLDPKYCRHVLIIGGVAPLLRLISNHQGGEELAGPMQKALLVLAEVAALSKVAKAAILKAGGVAPLLSICELPSMAAGPAVRVLEELSKLEEGRTGITDALGVITLIKLLNAEPNGEIGQITERILKNFWSQDPYVAIQMASVGMFKPLVARIAPENDMDTRVMMADAVMTWGVNMAGRVALVEAGVVPPLVDLLESDDPVAKVAAARAIEHLSHTEVNRVALAKAGVIPGLVKGLAKGTPEIKEAARATLANLAMDDQDLDTLDEDGAAIQLVEMLNSSAASSREYAVRTLESMVRDSKAIRSCVAKEHGAIAAIFEILRRSANSFTAGSVRTNALHLLSYMAQDPDALPAMVAGPNVVEVLAQLLVRPLDKESKEAIVVVLGAMASNAAMRPLLRRQEEILPALVKYVTTGPPAIREAALGALARMADPGDLETQVAVGQAGIIPIAIEILRSGSDALRVPAVVLLGNLAASTPQLTDKPIVSRGGKGFSVSAKLMASLRGAGKESRLCRVHGGRCSSEGTFCLVQEEVPTILLQLIEQGDAAMAEKSLDALATLLLGKDDQERAAEYLVRIDAIPVVAGQVGKSAAASEKAVWMLERIFCQPRFRQDKYSKPAVHALGRFMTTATGASRKVAADALFRLDILPSASISEGSL